MNNPRPHLKLWPQAAIGVLVGAVTCLSWAQDTRNPCPVEVEKKQLAAQAPASGMSRLLAALSVPIRSSQCGSLKSVLARVAAKPVTGGRKLEGDRPLDIAAAEAELRKAREDAEFAKALAAELDGEADPVRRALLEATLLDDFGHYKARDLLLTRLLASLAT